MLKTLWLCSLLSLSLFAYSDVDMDGVEDSVDQCPNTSLTELVDINGCTIKDLSSPHHYDIILGASYSQISPVTQEKTDTMAGSVQVDYYYKNFSVQVSTAFFNSESSLVSNSGQTDSFIGAYYLLKPLSGLSLRLGGGALLPTYQSDINNNNTDFTASLSASYLYKDFNLFGSYSYTMINDDDFSYTDTTSATVNVTYQNTNAFNLGAGFYPTAKLYTSLSYNSSDSIYEAFVSSTTGRSTVEPLESISAYLFYTLDKNWFTTANYAYGLSDSASDHYLSLRVGYYF